MRNHQLITGLLTFAVVAACTSWLRAANPYEANPYEANPDRVAEVADVDANWLTPKAKPNARAVDSAALHGIAMPAQEAILTSPIRGSVWELTAQEGDLVRKGAPLLSIDNRIAKAELEIAKATVARKAMMKRAELEFQWSDSQYKRVLEVHRRSASTDIEVEETRIRRDQAEAAYEAEVENQKQAIANLQLAERQLELHTVYAPFDGRIVRVFTKEGTDSLATPGLIQIASLDLLRVELYLPLGDYGRLEIGKSYPLTAEAPVSQGVSGILKFIDPIVDSGTQTFRCVFEIDNSDLSMPAGFGVRFGK
jgi:RND family efflux transporter MFP subunit